MRSGSTRGPWPGSGSCPTYGCSAHGWDRRCARSRQRWNAARRKSLATGASAWRAWSWMLTT